jgi:hypothetical protein
MEVLLRYLRQSPSGVTEFLDSAVTAPEITIGSAADCTVQLLGRAIASKHADIRRAGARLVIGCRRGNRVEVNGRTCASKPLAVGDKIGIAGHKLAIIQPPAGFDAAIEVRPDTTVGADEFEAAFVTDLLSLATVVLGLVIPLGMIYLHRHGTPTPVALPDDQLWSSGPLSSPHAHAAGRQCGACHQDLFVHVQDRACVACHKTTQDHISKHDRLLTRLGAAQRCGECHAEHMGDATRLAIENDHLCTNCHADSDKTFGTLKLEQVSGFASRQHPAFSVALQKLATPDGARGDAQWVAYRTPLQGASEHSNLKFSHSQHLDADKVTSLQSGGALGCGDCHTLGADGEHFLPVTMEKSCATCHTLNFDPSAPSRTLPHGKPLDAMLMIVDYYARKTFDPPKVAEREPERRLPDIDRDPARQLEIDACNGPPLVCARQRASREIDNQFNGRGCVSCHVVVDTKSGDPVDSKTGDLHERYQVTPVRLGYDYFPDSRFPHKSHLIQGKLSGDAACETCHAARKSTVSTELLLPNVDNCLQCHRDRAGGDAVATLVTAAKRANPAALVPTATAAPAATAADVDGSRKIVTLQCISCHVYHPTAISPGTRLAEQK